MKTLQELYEDLEKYKDFDEGENADKFLETIDEIILRKDPDSIHVLLLYFDDFSEYDWVFSSLSSALEFYDINDYVCELLKCLPMLIDKAPIFADNFFNRIFNSYDYFKIFKKNINLAPRESLLQLFDIMEKESPHHKGLIKELRAELNKN